MAHNAILAAGVGSRRPRAGGESETALAAGPVGRQKIKPRLARPVKQ